MPPLCSGDACARLDTGAVWCWGLDDSGQLGNGDGAQSGSVTPAPVALIGATLPAAQAVFAGEATSCAILTDDTVACWGRRLGAAGRDDAPTLVAGLSDIETLAIGREHACAATRTTGEVYCWGDNGHHALGVTSVSPTSTVLSLPAP